MKRRSGYNPKRRIAPADMFSPDERRRMATTVVYGGNPQHKRSPGDYGLTPPSQPRPDKTLCDGNRPIAKAEATELLRKGLDKGMCSHCSSQEWPQNVWAVSLDGEIFEAQLENREQGAYHGYPVPVDDDFRRVIQREWENR